MEVRMKRLFALTLVFSWLVAPGARAEDAPSPEVLRAAENLAAVITGDTISQMSSALVAQMWGGIEARLRDKVDAATLTEMRGEMERMLTKFVTDVMKGAPGIYARHFTVAEMGDLIAFYKTPTGAKALREMPKVAADTYALMAPRLPAFQQEVGATIEAVLKKHGYQQ
jgi:uncharacterized protein